MGCDGRVCGLLGDLADYQVGHHRHRIKGPGCMMQVSRRKTSWRRNSTRKSSRKNSMPSNRTNNRLSARRSAYQRKMTTTTPRALSKSSSSESQPSKVYSKRERTGTGRKRGAFLVPSSSKAPACTLPGMSAELQYIYFSQPYPSYLDAWPVTRG